MEFRLVYQGRLPAASQGNTRAREKHAIRRTLHPQLLDLWQTHQRLKGFWLNQHIMEAHLAGKHTKFGYRFVPLVCDYFGLVCSLDILFLRREVPGDLITSGGDLDNRMKVLFDALRIPANERELAGATPEPGENPFYCLLEDDKLITEVKITTDRMLTPKDPSEGQHDVHLIIHVRTIPLNTPTI